MITTIFQYFRHFVLNDPREFVIYPHLEETIRHVFLTNGFFSWFVILSMVTMLLLVILAFLKSSQVKLFAPCVVLIFSAFVIEKSSELSGFLNREVDGDNKALFLSRLVKILQNGSGEKALTKGHDFLDSRPSKKPTPTENEKSRVQETSGPEAKNLAKNEKSEEENTESFRATEKVPNISTNEIKTSEKDGPTEESNVASEKKRSDPTNKNEAGLSKDTSGSVQELEDDAALKSEKDNSHLNSDEDKNSQMISTVRDDFNNNTRQESRSKVFDSLNEKSEGDSSKNKSSDSLKGGYEGLVSHDEKPNVSFPQNKLSDSLRNGSVYFDSPDGISEGNFPENKLFDSLEKEIEPLDPSNDHQSLKGDSLKESNLWFRYKDLEDGRKHPPYVHGSRVTEGFLDPKDAEKANKRPNFDRSIVHRIDTSKLKTKHSKIGKKSSVSDSHSKKSTIKSKRLSRLLSHSHSKAGYFRSKKVTNSSRFLELPKKLSALKGGKSKNNQKNSFLAQNKLKKASNRTNSENINVSKEKKADDDTQVIEFSAAQFSGNLLSDLNPDISSLIQNLKDNQPKPSEVDYRIADLTNSFNAFTENDPTDAIPAKSLDLKNTNQVTLENSSKSAQKANSKLRLDFTKDHIQRQHVFLDNGMDLEVESTPIFEQAYQNELERRKLIKMHKIGDSAFTFLTSNGGSEIQKHAKKSRKSTLGKQKLAFKSKTQESKSSTDQKTMNSVIDEKPNDSSNLITKSETSQMIAPLKSTKSQILDFMNKETTPLGSGAENSSKQKQTLNATQSISDSESKDVLIGDDKEIKSDNKGVIENVPESKNDLKSNEVSGVTKANIKSKSDNEDVNTDEPESKKDIKSNEVSGEKKDDIKSKSDSKEVIEYVPESKNEINSNEVSGVTKADIKSKSDSKEVIENGPESQNDIKGDEVSKKEKVNTKSKSDSKEVIENKPESKNEHSEQNQKVNSQKKKDVGSVDKNTVTTKSAQEAPSITQDLAQNLSKVVSDCVEVVNDLTNLAKSTVADTKISKAIPKKSNKSHLIANHKPFERHHRKIGQWRLRLPQNINKHLTSFMKTKSKHEFEKDEKNEQDDNQSDDEETDPKYLYIQQISTVLENGERYSEKFTEIVDETSERYVSGSMVLRKLDILFKLFFEKSKRIDKELNSIDIALPLLDYEMNELKKEFEKRFALVNDYGAENDTQTDMPTQRKRKEKNTEKIVNLMLNADSEQIDFSKTSHQKSDSEKIENASEVNNLSSDPNSEQSNVDFQKSDNSMNVNQNTNYNFEKEKNNSEISNKNNAFSKGEEFINEKPVKNFIEQHLDEIEMVKREKLKIKQSSDFKKSTNDIKTLQKAELGDIAAEDHNITDPKTNPNSFEAFDADVGFKNDINMTNEASSFDSKTIGFLDQPREFLSNFIQNTQNVIEKTLNRKNKFMKHASSTNLDLSSSFLDQKDTSNETNENDKSFGSNRETETTQSLNNQDGETIDQQKEERFEDTSNKVVEKSNSDFNITKTRSKKDSAAKSHRNKFNNQHAKKAEFSRYADFLEYLISVAIGQALFSITLIISILIHSNLTYIFRIILMCLLFASLVLFFIGMFYSQELQHNCILRNSVSCKNKIDLTLDELYSLLGIDDKERTVDSIKTEMRRIANRYDDQKKRIKMHVVNFSGSRLNEKIEVFHNAFDKLDFIREDFDVIMKREVDKTSYFRDIDEMRVLLDKIETLSRSSDILDLLDIEDQFAQITWFFREEVGQVSEKLYAFAKDEEKENNRMLSKECKFSVEKMCRSSRDLDFLLFWVGILIPVCGILILI